MRRDGKDYLCSEEVELLGTSASNSSLLHLTLGDHVHEFDAAQQYAGTTKILEAQHGPCAPLYRPVILLYNVVQILVLADLDRYFPLRVKSIQRGQVRTAFIDCHRLGFTVLVD